MHIIGLIAEYNPLHLGHTYQIKKIKETYPNSIIILVTNSTFTQRGDISIINKWNKTKLALDNNIDLVLELPFVYATQSADIFAKGALEILNYLKIDTLVFGSESNNINNLKKIANTQLKNKNFNNIVKKHLKTGTNYPTALNNALKELNITPINNPNDILGISYIKEIIKNNYKITPKTIKRTNNYHDKKTKEKIIPAQAIRTLLKTNRNIKNHIPPYSQKNIYKNLSLDNYYPYLKYKIIISKNLSIYQTTDEGIENRIKKYINTSTTWEELVKNIKTKRYTYNKINRMLTHILVSFTKEEAQNIKIDYLRILGFSKEGKNYLNKIKKTIPLKIITHYKKNISHTLDIELRATTIYNLEIKENLIKEEYSHKPIIKP